MNRIVAVAASMMIAALVVSGCSSDDEKEVVVVHDTLANFSEDSEYQFDLSMYSKREFASLVIIREPISVTEIMWSGVLDTLATEPGGFVDDSAVFVVAIYTCDEDEKPVREPMYASFVVAKGHWIEPDAAGQGLLEAFGGHEFTFSFDDQLTLYPGRYWVSVAGAGSEDIGFYWSVEAGNAGDLVGSGGAKRDDETLPWGSAVFTEDMDVARGYSLRVTGLRE